MEKTRKRFLTMITVFMMLFTLVVILPEGAIKASADEVSVSTAAELKNALSDTSNRNKVLKMTKDITVSENVDVSFNVTLNLVGHKLTFDNSYLNVEMSSGSEVFTIIGGTLKGNHPGGIVYLRNGYVYFESGVIENTFSSTNKSSGQSFNCYKGGIFDHIVVNKGTFTSNAPFSDKIIIAEDSHKSTDGNTTRVYKATNYKLKVGGKQVHSANCKDILGDGVFSYNDTTKTLTVNGDYKGSELLAILNDGISGLTINTAKDSTINGCVYVRADTTFTGSGKLTVNNSKGYCIATLDGGSMTVGFKDTTVEANGQYAISGGSKSSKAWLAVDNATVIANGTETGVNWFNGGFKFNGVNVLKPAGGMGKYGNIYEKNGTTVAKKVVIGKYEEYDLSVAGKDVTSSNCDDVLGDGVFSYDNTTKTLTIKGNYNGENSSVIVNRGIKGLTINTAADSTVHGYIYSKVDTTFTGSGKLTVNHDEGFCIGTLGNDEMTITVKDTTIEANGEYAVCGGSDTCKAALTVDNATIIANGTKLAVARFNNGFKFNGVDFVEPKGAIAKNGTVYEKDGTTVANNVVIDKVENYGLKVAGTNVTSGNCDDILGDGNISYNNATKTLTVKGSINGVDRECILNKSVEGLTINIASDVTFKDGDISTYKNTVITGDGKLTGYFNGNSNYQYFIVHAAKLTFKNANVEINAGAGFAGYTEGGVESDLVFDNSNITVKAEGSVIPSHRAFGSITFTNGSAIVSPEGAVVKEGRIYESDGTTLAKDVVITPKAKCTEHTPGEAVKENIVDPDCTNAGSYDLVVYCTVCGEEISRKTVTVNALGHDWGEWTLSEDGTEESRVCARCGEVETRKVGAIKGDVNGDGVVNASDIVAVAAHVKGVKKLEGDALKRADVSGDGAITVTDISMIAAHVKGQKPLK